MSSEQCLRSPETTVPRLYNKNARRGVFPFRFVFFFSFLVVLLVGIGACGGKRYKGRDVVLFVCAVEKELGCCERACLRSSPFSFCPKRTMRELEVVE
jgi:hypothetical protein